VPGRPAGGSTCHRPCHTPNSLPQDRAVTCDYSIVIVRSMSLAADTADGFGCGYSVLPGAEGRFWAGWQPCGEFESSLPGRSHRGLIHSYTALNGSDGNHH
jgi:hypothetical protein